MDVLSRQGGSRIRVRDICEALGVTTGSFYSHFESREEFVRSLVSFWDTRYTTEIARRVLHAPGDAKSRLIQLAEAIIREDLNRYEEAIRAWAAQEPAVAPLVRKIDRERLNEVGALFAELGFRGASLEMRTRTFVTYYSLDDLIQVRRSKRQRLQEVKSRVEMLCRPARG